MLNSSNEGLSLRTLGLLQLMSKQCTDTFRSIWTGQFEEIVVMLTRSTNENQKKVSFILIFFLKKKLRSLFL